MATTATNNITVQIFENKEFGSFRALKIDGKDYFVGKDIADILGYANSRDALTLHVDEEDKRIIQKSEITTLEIPNRGLTVINESGLYSLILSSKLPTAKKFKHWVTSEVLPSVREHGLYMTTEAVEKFITAPETILQIVQNWKKDRDKLVVAEQTIQDMTPHYELGKKVGDTKAAISVKEFSEVLCKNGYKIGQNNLFRWFVDRGYLYKRGRKYLICQDYLDQKLFDVIEQVFNLPGTEVEQVNVKIMITGKGQDYFLNKFEEEKNLASIQGE